MYPEFERSPDGPVNRLVNIHQAIIIMGVSGCGKSTAGKSLARNLGCQFIEGDELHPISNVEKMKRGVPLCDADRWPWLDLIASTINDGLQLANKVVASCSALKRSYRERLRAHISVPVTFVFMDVKEEALFQRIARRNHEFMPSLLLDSQLRTLERPQDEADVMILSGIEPAEEIFRLVVSHLSGQSYT